MSQIKLVGLVGSLRKDSYNRKLLNLVKTLLPEGVTLEEVDYSEVPLFNEDHEWPTPASVSKVRDQILEADGILFITPEYNQSLSGVLKNVIDWVSRPANKDGLRVLAGKRAFVMGATMGISGTITAQEHLRSILAFMGVNVLSQPRATISSVHTKVNEDGSLNLDPITLGFVQQTVNAFVEYVKQ